MKKLMKMMKNEDGQVLVLAALLMVVLFGFTAITIDVGRVRTTQANLQKAADAAALAGAQDLPTASTALSTAIVYAGKNGMKATANGVIKLGDTVTATTPYNNDSTKIEVVCTRKVSYTFAKVLGFKDKDVSSRAVAQKSGFSSDAFNYAVFAGEGEASFNGSKHVFDGGVYGRDGVSLGNNASIPHGNAVSSNGTCGPSGTTFGTGRIVTNNPVIPMPDFSDLIKAQGIECANQADFNTKFGGKTIDGPIYVNGNLTINGRIKGNGIIYASGTITFLNDNILQTSSDSICFYSENGDMTFNGGSGVVVGILYAPNGKIRVNGGPNSTTYGRIIAKEVDVNGAKASVYASVNDLNGLNTLNSLKLVQ